MLIIKLKILGFEFLNQLIFNSLIAFLVIECEKSLVALNCVILLLHSSGKWHRA